MRNTRTLSILAIFGLTACNSSAPGIVRTDEEVEADEAPIAEALAVEHEAGWFSVVSARLNAEAQAISWQKSGVFAALPALGLSAEFDERGVVISGERGGLLSIQTIAWGRADALTEVEAREPTPGDCTTDRDAMGRCVRRLEYTEPGLTEWWIGLGRGLEQGWTIDEAPPGSGPLVVEIAIGGALLMERDLGRVVITDQEGRAWGVSDVHAWDAHGDPLQVDVTLTAEGLRLSVDDAGAAWPVSIDPVYDTAAWMASTEDGGFGKQLAGAGDVNGDGYDDVIIGADTYRSRTGRVYLYHGSASGLSDDAAVMLTGPDSETLFGEAVSGAGDVNGDGFDDVIVGGYYGDVAFVYYGSPDGIVEDGMLTLSGEPNSDFGADVSWAGDVNRDGYDDVIVGAPDSSTSTGHAYLFHGSSTGLAATASTTLTSSLASTSFGSAVSGAGDIDDDGYDDVVVGAYQYGSSTGRVYTFAGSSSGVSTTASATLTGGTSKDCFGYDVASAGDVNRDGYDDIVVGAMLGGSSAGQAIVYYGSDSGLSSSAATTLSGEGTSTYFGFAVSGAGDVNGDRYDDIVVGAYKLASQTGRAYIYHGSSGGIASTATTTMDGESTGDLYAYAAANAGDVDGDGYDDVIVGSRATSAYLYRGSSSGLSDTAATTVTGTAAEDFGDSLSSAGDVNGDGFDDIIIGAYSYLAETGRAYVFHGSAAGPSTIASSTLTGAAAGDRFGVGVSGAGDVNDDGFDDIIVGSSGSLSNTGRAYVFHGSADGVSETSATTLTGTDVEDYFGNDVSDAGDVNGDGFDDVIVGATGADSTMGQATVYLGSTDGVSTVATTTLSGEVSSDAFGGTVSAAGDVNGDGYDDVLVAAYTHATSTGRAYVFHGSAAGVETSATTTLDGAKTYTYFGRAASDAGDVNGDGYDDIIIGAFYEPAVYVYYGSSSGVSTTGATRSSTGSSVDFFGWSVSGAGDVDGDGYSDVVVGQPEVYRGLGAIYVYLGSSAGLTGSGGVRILGSDYYTYFGEAVSGAGDVNGDGYDDILVNTEDELVYLFLGYTPDADGDGALPETDCDDADPSVFPGAEEVCDGLDNDCDVSTPDCASPDADGDGYGDPATEVDVGGAPAGYVTNQDDCDDTDASTYPGAPEVVGDGVDQSCDGAEVCYSDGDGDGAIGLGYTPSPDTDCEDDGEGDLSRMGEDCDDSDAAIYPGAAEIPGDAVDQDCDGEESCYTDLDEDGYRTDTVQTSTDLDCDDASEATASDPDGDCDDSSAAYSPGVAERCDDANSDEDCNGFADNNDLDPEGEVEFYADADMDGYTDPTSTTWACDAPYGYKAATDPDCDDSDPTRSPGASDIPGDGVDQDCDGADAEVEAGDSGQDTDTDSGEDTDTDLSEDSGEDTTPPGSGADKGEDGAASEGCGCASGGGRAGGLWVLLVLGAASPTLRGGAGASRSARAPRTRGAPPSFGRRAGRR